MSFRIAPTPSGYLHIGNAFNFILTTLLACSNGASLRLRIDDVDAMRLRPEYLTDIFETLHWLGLEWQEGPRDESDHRTHFSQSLRGGLYEEFIQRLIDTGSVFACNCSRKTIAEQAGNRQYPGTCRGKALPLDAPDVSLRLLTQQSSVVSFHDGLLGAITIIPFAVARDPVIRRRDGLAAYHVASLADDLVYGITHIVRGADLLPSTAVQLFISQQLGTTAFRSVEFLHHPLLVDDSGGKLSKSAGSSSMRAMRVAGLPAAEVYKRFSAWMQWPREAANLDEAASIFAAVGMDGLR